MAENAEETLNEVLMCAASSGSLWGVRTALKAGADVNFAFDGETGLVTALFNATIAGHVDVVKLLLRKGAAIAMRCTEYGWSPLHAAAIRGNTEMVEVLVHHGATVDIRDASEVTPITWACYHGHVDTVRQLIEFGARVDLLLDRKNFKVEGPVTDSRIRAGLKLARETRETKLLRCCNPKCSKPGHRSDLKRCAACKMTRYCSRECQRQHWVIGHKNCCGDDCGYEEYLARNPEFNDMK